MIGENGSVQSFFEITQHQIGSPHRAADRMFRGMTMHFKDHFLAPAGQEILTSVREKISNTIIAPASFPTLVPYRFRL
jgi:hypothetical protein